MKTVLVTGFNGFFGSNLIPELEKKFNIIGISRSKYSGVKIKQITCDISKISKINPKEKISTIIHLAALTDVNFCQNNPEKAFINNIQGTREILEFARRKDSNVIFVSTAHVFGKIKKNPIRENHEKNPISVYGITKLAGEIMCKEYSSSYGLNIAVPRLFSIYGPYSPTHSVSNNIILSLIHI